MTRNRNEMEPRGRRPKVEGAFNSTELRPESGVLAILEDGWGEMRRVAFDYASRPDDVLVPPAMVREQGLAQGSLIAGKAAPGSPPGGPPHAVLREITGIDGLPPDSPLLKARTPFKSLTSIDPIERLRVAGAGSDTSLRILDLLTPLGKGQRGLIVAPPRTGKTVLLQSLAQAIARNHPDAHLMVLLVDERPEEATDWKRSLRGEVVSSTSDEMAASHVAVAEIVIERAKRLVELGRDVVLLFDSLTRLGRAYNLETKNSGRTLSGGVDARTLEKPKAFFGAARKAEEGGSLTIIATALIETGSRMDQVIFEEFKGTGNMELVLSRKLADLRLFPAVDIHLSGTRKEEKLLSEEELECAWTIRRGLRGADPADGMKLLLQKVEGTRDNDELIGLFKKRS